MWDTPWKQAHKSLFAILSLQENRCCASKRSTQDTLWNSGGWGVFPWSPDVSRRLGQRYSCPDSTAQGKGSLNHRFLENGCVHAFQAPFKKHFWHLLSQNPSENPFHLLPFDEEVPSKKCGAASPPPKKEIASLFNLTSLFNLSPLGRLFYWQQREVDYSGVGTRREERRSRDSDASCRCVLGADLLRNRQVKTR